MLLGKKLKVLRTEHGMLQRQIASILDIDTPLYSKYERGERLPKFQHIHIIAKLFNVDERELRVLYLSDKIIKSLDKEYDIKFDVINNIVINTRHDINLK